VQSHYMYVHHILIAKHHLSVCFLGSKTLVCLIVSKAMIERQMFLAVEPKRHYNNSGILRPPESEHKVVH
jgi:hypothetical protein